MPALSSQNFGILLCLLATMLFAVQDAFSKYLAGYVPVPQFVMVRYWAFFAFALMFAARREGILHSFKTPQIGLQILRGSLLVAEVLVLTFAFRVLSLAEANALFAIYPVLVILLAGVFLGELITRTMIILAALGFCGALVIIRPGVGVFQAAAVYPFISAGLFASYTVLSRYLSGRVSYTSNMLYIGTCGAVLSSLLGIFSWQELSPHLWLIIGGYAFVSLFSHSILIKALEYTEASVIQPFLYFQLLWAVVISHFFFGDTPDLATFVGMGLIIVGGISLLAVKKKLDSRP